MGFHGSISSVTWSTALDGTYFATGCGDKSVCVWQLLGEGDDYRVRLHWSSNHGGLVVSGTTIHEAQGLSRVNAKLLQQRGAVGDPVPPLNFREASEKLITMATAISHLGMPPNRGMSSTFPAAGPSSRENLNSTILGSIKVPGEALSSLGTLNWLGVVRALEALVGVVLGICVSAALVAIIAPAVLVLAEVPSSKALRPLSVLVCSVHDQRILRVSSFGSLLVLRVVVNALDTSLVSTNKSADMTLAVERSARWPSGLSVCNNCSGSQEESSDLDHRYWDGFRSRCYGADTLLVMLGFILPLKPRRSFSTARSA
ncbi:hypothetical protein BC939DRAFT_489628 [Gamsiella multidivaricata]|uniref:uncharacterized protein n=1 Tax=Gamsiella multidivaricata TaxID=101098 RepID=UPI002220B478|nr:uncharacterized protein BC939DRAFT_489628 [Gamsiella multidivaricata]KAI7830638.1 hypothetical protein BC939DRAFT_489628 [Gamsiella multidivaricata]